MHLSRVGTRDTVQKSWVAILGLGYVEQGLRWPTVRFV